VVAERSRRRFQPPRAVYWILGAAIAFVGAAAARLIAEGAAAEYRIAIWFAGTAVVFLGLSVLSLGTKARLDDQSKEPNHQD
jgi:cytochrome c biogenesis protein CcdA